MVVNKISRLVIGSIFSICLMFFSGATLAISVPFVIDCSFGSVLLPAGGGGDLTTSTDCENFNGGGPLGNDTQSNITASEPLFGITDWTLGSRSGSSAGDDAIILLGVVNGGSSGSWSVSSFNGFTDVFLTLKAGNGFAAYLLDTTVTSGDWTTEFGLDNKDLSHMSLYYSPGVPQVPVPAAFWLFGTALVGFIGLSRRRKVA